MGDHRSIALAAALLLATALGAHAEPVRLVLVVSIDQLRADRLDSELPAGLGRLAREGRFYRDAVLDHAISETCPGHAVMLTGHHPGATGLVGNRFFDAEQEGTGCVVDLSEGSEIIGAEKKKGASPRTLRVTALGDWMKQANPDARVFAVSGKDRAAIALGGQQPDAAYWLRDNEPVGFTSSRYYMEALPEWVEHFNGADPPEDGFFSWLPEQWVHDPVAVKRSPREDDYAGEADQLSRTSPHPLRDDDLEVFAEQLFASPYVDDVMLAFATELVLQEGLGRGPATDLLAVSLSGTDIVGHRYGPYSHESADALVRLDAALGKFIDFLEERLGAGSVLVALSADHGVLPLPEWVAEIGESTCAVDGGRAGLRGMGLGLLWRMHWKLSPFRLPRQWIDFAGSRIAVNRSLAESRGVEIERAVEVAREYLAEQPAIAHVWTREEIETGTSEVARLYRNSYDPDRSGDLAVQIAPTCLISFYDVGTSHGTPYDYDRRIPLVFWGTGLEPRRVTGPAASVDIAPTLAHRLGVAAPADLDGKVLFDD
jgi:predicted AlkP superfamily pyrophosphatase or phosphodiesterase